MSDLNAFINNNHGRYVVMFAKPYIPLHLNYLTVFIRFIHLSLLLSSDAPLVHDRLCCDKGRFSILTGKAASKNTSRWALQFIIGLVHQSSFDGIESMKLLPHRDKINLLTSALLQSKQLEQKLGAITIF